MPTGNRHRGDIDKIADLTDRLEEMEQCFEAFFNRVLYPCLITNNVTDVVKVNKAWLNIFGFTEEYIYSKGWLFFVHPEDVEKTLQCAERMGNGEDIFGFTNRYRTADGEYKLLLWNAPFFKNGRSYCIARNLTAIKDSGVP